MSCRPDHEPRDTVNGAERDVVGVVDAPVEGIRGGIPMIHERQAIHAGRPRPLESPHSTAGPIMYTREVMECRLA